MNTRLALITVLLLATGGCGELYIGPDGPDPASRPLRCQQPADEPSGMQVLMAQSVSSASAVPCLNEDVTDWLVTVFEVKNGRARVEFTHRYGRNDTATLELTADCDVGAAREVSSRFDGMRRYNQPGNRGGRYTDRIYFVSPGACTALRFDLSGAGADLRGAEISGVLGFVSRADLDRQIRTASDGHLHLDDERR
jgi:hypothetical protein